MDVNKQTQQAGDNSQQMQANNITIINNNGLTEEQVNERVKKVVNELIPVAIKGCTEEARETANERIAKLENYILPKISQVDGMIEAFRDPAFQRVLVKAEQEAAVSERNADYELLTELLVCHVQKGTERKNRVGIEKAIEIVDRIDNDALCGLTMVHAINHLDPSTGNVQEGLIVLNDAFRRLEYEKLPKDDEWIEHLEMLGAIRVTNENKFKKIIEFYSQRVEGYVCVGIRKDSEDYKKALKMLQGTELDSVHFLVKNELLNDYMRLNISDPNIIPELAVRSATGYRKVTENERKVLEQIWEMYEKNIQLQKVAEESFLKMWDSYDALKELRKWWDAIPTCFCLTKIGRILAHTNAKRCLPYVPDMI